MLDVEDFSENRVAPELGRFGMRAVRQLVVTRLAEVAPGISTISTLEALGAVAPRSRCDAALHFRDRIRTKWLFGGYHYVFRLSATRSDCLARWLPMPYEQICR